MIEKVRNYTDQNLSIGAYHGDVEKGFGSDAIWVSNLAVDSQFASS